MVLPVII
jgi:hypothetical protein